MHRGLFALHRPPKVCRPGVCPPPPVGMRLPVLVSNRNVLILYTHIYVCFYVAVLQSGLKNNFAEVDVAVTDCPDLTKEPFTLACAGKMRI